MPKTRRFEGMRLLAIETSSEACSVALMLGGQKLEKFKLAPREHAALVLPWVEELLSEAGVALSSLDTIAFSRGPGSFTSLRIGIGVVQGLAWGSDLPVVPVSSLRASAQAAAAMGVERAIVAMDARMQEVYTGRFSMDEAGFMQGVDTERVCKPELAAKGPVEGWSGVGNGFERYDALKTFACDLDSVLADTWPRASVICELAENWLSTNEALPPKQAQPVYLRDNVAKKPAA